MAAPNIANVATITGKTVAVALSSTSATTIVNNPASSNKVFKLNSLIVSNVDGTNNASITIQYYSAANIGGTAFPLVFTVIVPADATLVVLGKDTQIYLEEDKSIGATASAANDLTVIASYEEIS
jgi:Na+-transporting NADH:ubiquinone oxidoreductase subunit NqrB